MLGFGSLFGGSSLFGGPNFTCELKAQPVTLAGKEDLENGNRLILPAEVLQQLQALNVPSPMLFEISDLEGHRRTHGGVLEFTAPADTCYLPAWILRQLHADDGDVLRLRLKQLPKATYLRIQPSSVALMRVFNPRALLENGLREYVAATVGDCFDVEYAGRKYGLEVLEVRPGDAACLVDADVEVDFATAKDAEAAAAATPSRSSRDLPEDENLYSGEGHRLGKERAAVPSVCVAQDAEEDVDPMPWKKRIPRGVKWTTPPYGADAVRLARGVATPGWSVPGGGGSSGSRAEPEWAFTEPSPENRARALAAAEAREAAQAEEIAERRRKEEQERERQEREERREEARRKAREEERKAWARETLGLGPDGKPLKPPKRSVGARFLAACCRCLTGRRAQAPQAPPARPEPLRI